MKKIIASGPVIVDGGRLLIIKDDKDNFYKLPGGTVDGKDSLEETCLRELEEETGYKGRIIKKLHTIKLNKNPKTGEKMEIELNHYKCELITKPENYEPFKHHGHKVEWVYLYKLVEGQYPIAPNIYHLILKGDINADIE
ncbi:MAG: NUDIX domain-containing protein [Candidatus Pacearchaeota archaeon]|nr:NUDIX domain-containing protein [Candidatus Pacearchaeota archaeon]